MSLSINPQHVSALLWLAWSSLLHAGTPFPVRIDANIKSPRPDATLKVFVERDDSNRFQQYLQGASPDSQGRFHVTIQRPGLYWLVASEETQWSYRRGACLLDVDENGKATLKPVPPIRVGRKWGGPEGTQSCRKGNVPLSVYRGKPSRNKKSGSVK